jgi:hypothetical protein
VLLISHTVSNEPSARLVRPAGITRALRAFALVRREVEVEVHNRGVALGAAAQLAVPVHLGVGPVPRPSGCRPGQANPDAPGRHVGRVRPDRPKARSAPAEPQARHAVPVSRVRPESGTLVRQTDISAQTGTTQIPDNGRRRFRIMCAKWLYCHCQAIVRDCWNHLSNVLAAQPVVMDPGAVGHGGIDGPLAFGRRRFVRYRYDYRGLDGTDRPRIDCAYAG